MKSVIRNAALLAVHDPAGNQPALTFNHHDNQYWLSGVWTSAADGLAVR